MSGLLALGPRRGVGLDALKLDNSYFWLRFVCFNYIEATPVSILTEEASEKDY